MPIQLVRHGSYDREGLTEEGKRQSESARSRLLAKGLGEEAVILSSSALRAVQTAEIIAQGVGDETVLTSTLIMEAAEDPTMIRSLDRVIERALEDNGVTHKPDALVVVAHMPLLSMHKYGDPFTETPNGGIVEYEQGTWQNPHYHSGPYTQEFEQKYGLTQ